MLRKKLYLLSSQHFSQYYRKTTDVSTKKSLAILLRYYSSETKKVCDSILELVELDNGSSETSLMGYLV